MPFLDWRSNKGSQIAYTELSTTVDFMGNSVIAGSTINSDGDYDIIVTKQNKYGNELWTSQVSGTGNGDDFAASVAHDALGNTYVCGAIENTPSGSYDFWLRKYSATGEIDWTIELSNPNGGHRVATDIALDENQNLFVSGADYDAFLAAFEIPLPSGFDEVEYLREELNPFPNPATESVWVPFIPSAEQQNCNLVDGLGRLITTINCPIYASGVIVDLKGVSPGIYSILYSRPHTKSSKLIVQ
ncbi:MAG: hypothetical protein COA49_09815 [Bacteroidetes bacterium]|nr:MAG: hypothetical protein COA49_09815 [Bacteroidota bacterium]